MAGMWFNGVMGSFSAYSVIGNGNRQEVPPHLDGGASRQTNYNVQNRAGDSNNAQPNNNQYTTRIDYSSTTPQPTDTTKTVGQSDVGLAINQPKPYSPQPVSEGGKSSDKEKGK
jgi:hypothetical protein